ncbi:MAG TPA: RagB/SusD family nutrient uptake outer membrane protein [Paludibacter sp.]|nr:RagB/SusD family nutrient uptake outer membrane protein [Paludibacter sp.]HOS45601.1 RagB/SusD family nutrient uptake outer membrane protein [Paludibacter sp.]HPM09429.1 RagB/SusD family nutrient uptake outer membrane protein [Paludibacter sp.]
MMKPIKKTILFTFISLFVFSSCDELLNVNSERVVFPDEYDFTGANDTLFSMFGVLSQLENLANTYVLLGELRGDLVELSDESSAYLKEIHNFNISKSNPYANQRDYYAIINNCNYIIQRIDTAVVRGNKQVMMREFAACKAIRAWTYMQLALNFGSVTYYEQPVLSVKDEGILKAKPKMTLEEIAPLLIRDILPYRDVEEPRLGILSNYNTNYSYFPIRALLGDLYLWLGEYEQAAQAYYDFFYHSENFVIADNKYESYIEVLNNAFTNNYITNWSTIFTTDAGTEEFVTNLATSNEFGQKFELDSLTSNQTLVPSKIALDNWNNQIYYYSAELDTVGDLRKIGSVSLSNRALVRSSSDSELENDDYYIYKYLSLNNPSVDFRNRAKQVLIYRKALLYLRYAEALNRAGKPNAAFAVIKNGLNNSNLSNRLIIPHRELEREIAETTVPSQLDPAVDSIQYDTIYFPPKYMDFREYKFNNNIGIRMRGLGRVNVDTTHYVIPNLPSLQDSILFVEDKIQEELALETAFEGNRYHDLMRIAIRRDDNAYLADKVAKNHPDDYNTIKDKLMTRENWFIK